jgi:hypothetical protein
MTTDVQVLDKQDAMGSGVGSADAEMVQPAVDPQADAAIVVDTVVPDPVVGVGVAAGGGLGFGEVGVDGRGVARCGRQWLYLSVNTSSTAGSSATVLGWTGWAASNFLRVCWKRSTLPQVVGWLGLEFFWATASVVVRPRGRCSRPWPPAKRVVMTIPLSVNVEPEGRSGHRGQEASRTVGPVTG